MPIYEYRCQQCEQRFEKLVLAVGREPADLACPRCGSADVARLISRVAVSSGGDQAPADSAEDTAPKPPVFGRKELKKSLEERGY